MWTSGRMSNAKNLLGLGVSLYFWGLMDLTTTVLSGSARPLIEGQEDNLSDKLHQRMKPVSYTHLTLPTIYSV